MLKLYFKTQCMIERDMLKFCLKQGLPMARGGIIHPIFLFPVILADFTAPFLLVSPEFP